MPPPMMKISGSTALIKETTPAANARTDRSHTALAAPSPRRWAFTSCRVEVKRPLERCASAISPMASSRLPGVAMISPGQSPLHPDDSTAIARRKSGARETDPCCRTVLSFDGFTLFGNPAGPPPGEIIARGEAVVTNDFPPFADRYGFYIRPTQIDANG